MVARQNAKCPVVVFWVRVGLGWVGLGQGGLGRIGFSSSGFTEDGLSCVLHGGWCDRRNRDHVLFSRAQGCRGQTLTAACVCGSTCTGSIAVPLAGQGRIDRTFNKGGSGTVTCRHVGRSKPGCLATATVVVVVAGYLL